ncbi:hypothetical protein HAX54_002859 [Datura stramonium]|uniref:Uncharacterized protein n=1 Tax=Datura stramonium TaxID=4076 RepID=A0ABS8WTS8_DATST|nr:hypothetical protein [Datura stramonium]
MMLWRWAQWIHEWPWIIRKLRMKASQLASEDEQMALDEDENHQQALEDEQMAMDEDENVAGIKRAHGNHQSSPLACVAALSVGDIDSSLARHKLTNRQIHMTRPTTQFFFVMINNNGDISFLYSQDEMKLRVVGIL